jgi:hypothetical protein
MPAPRGPGILPGALKLPPHPHSSAARVLVLNRKMKNHGTHRKHGKPKSCQTSEPHSPGLGDQTSNPPAFRLHRGSHFRIQRGCTAKMPEDSPDEGLNRMGTSQPRGGRPIHRQTARWNRESPRWQASGRSGAGFGLSLTRAYLASERNRRVQTRTHGGVGPVAGSSSQSRVPDCASFSVPPPVLESGRCKKHHQSGNRNSNSIKANVDQKSPQTSNAEEDYAWDR